MQKCMGLNAMFDRDKFIIISGGRVCMQCVFFVFFLVMLWIYTLSNFCIKIKTIVNTWANFST